MAKKKIERGSFEWWAKYCRTNTGSHFLDSGGHYGYNYERSTPKEPTYFNGEYWSISLTHFLDQVTESNEACVRMQGIYDEWENSRDDYYSPEEFIEFLKARGVFVNFKMSGYTYNDETSLDQDFQYTVIEDDRGDSYAFIQPHCGCDARGGFPKPEIVKVITEDYFYDWKVMISCGDCGQEDIAGEEDAKAMLESKQGNDHIMSLGPVFLGNRINGQPLEFGNLKQIEILRQADKKQEVEIVNNLCEHCLNNGKLQAMSAWSTADGW